MITPDDLAVRFAPPVTRGPLYTRQLRFTDAAYQLAEQALDALPRGHHLDRAVTSLEEASHWLCAGLAAVVAEQALENNTTERAPEADPIPGAEPILYAWVAVDAPEPSTPAPPPATQAGAPGLDVVSFWRNGVLASGLHPLAKLTGAVLAEAAGPDGRIEDAYRPSNEALCAAIQHDLPTLLMALEDLCAHGWLSRTYGPGPVRYALLLPTPTT